MKDKEGSVKKRARTTARFAPPSLPSASEAWVMLKERLRPPSHPSTTSESAIDSSFNHTDLFVDSEPRDRDARRTVELLNPLAGTASKHKPRRRYVAKSSNANSNSRFGDDEDPNPTNHSGHDPVNHIVVDNDFEQFTPQLAKSETASTSHTGPEGPAGHGIGDDESPISRSDAGSISRATRGWARRSKVYELVIERLYPNLLHFLDSSFPEPAKEKSFQKEAWFMNKPGALMSGCYFLIAWILTTSLLPQPLTLFSWIAYVAIGGFFTAPIIFLIIFDCPRRHPWIYQPWLTCATWVFADILVIEMKTCGFFSFDNRCGGRNFIYLFGWALGQPVLAVFVMKQARPLAIVGAVQWLILVCALLMTEDNYPTLFYRNLVTFSLFHAFIIATSFMRERSERQMFALRQQLKIQYRATQSAQVMERRAGDSKKRFVSYIFHEVRVPLNTALLAVQNLEGEEVFKGLQSDQAEMVHGLMGSLTMMEKVLNDVLSFNRMESGKFAQSRRPFSFHKSIQLVALSHRMQAQMAGIDLEVDLDSAIDKIGGTFVGDEMRLRQVTSNLVSNSIKFTERGSVRIVTKLLYPRVEPTPSSEIDDPLRIAQLNAEAQSHAHVHAVAQTYDPSAVGRGKKEGSGIDGSEEEKLEYGAGDVEKGLPHSTATAANVLEMRRNSWNSAREREREREEKNRFKAIVRVEIHDTGVGLKKQDVIDNRLFSPYVQTEIGRRQGGKGSGLGLALVRQIIKLSNGRLGVESTFGKGSMFWFELPYSLPRDRRDTEASTLVPPPVVKHDFARPWPSPSRSISYHHPPRPEVEDARTRVLTDVQQRPVILPTESTAPLLTRQQGGVPMDSRGGVGLDEINSNTFPTVRTDSMPESDLMSPEVRADGRDPFMGAAPPPNRRSSDLSEVVPASATRRSQERDHSRGSAIQLQPIPVSPRQTARATVPAPSPGVDDEDRPLCTLVVDDDKLTRMLMSRMLTRLGHQVTTAENGRMALDMLTDSFEGKENAPRYDIVFLDNQMPMMSGVEVASNVREMGNHIFIVGCTGNALREDQEEYIAAGADGIIPKPIHQGAVMGMIQEARRRIRGETSWSPPDEDARRDRM